MTIYLKHELNKLHRKGYVLDWLEPTAWAMFYARMFGREIGMIPVLRKG